MKIVADLAARCFMMAAVCGATAPAISMADPGHAARKDPIFDVSRGAAPRTKSAINFQVDFEGGSYAFPAALKLSHGVLGGTVTAPSGCVGMVNSGSTDENRQLNLQVTFGGDCDGEASSFVGTLKFKKGSGRGTFTDPYASGPYVASKL